MTVAARLLEIGFKSMRQRLIIENVDSKVDLSVGSATDRGKDEYSSLYFLSFFTSAVVCQAFFHERFVRLSDMKNLLH